MYEALISRYIKNLSIDDINNFANKNNMPLNNDEAQVIYVLIMNNWKDIYKGDPTNVFNTLKMKVSENTYNNIMILYNQYKGMIK